MNKILIMIAMLNAACGVDSTAGLPTNSTMSQSLCVVGDPTCNDGNGSFPGTGDPTTDSGWYVSTTYPGSVQQDDIGCTTGGGLTSCSVPVIINLGIIVYVCTVIYISFNGQIEASVSCSAT